MNALVLTAIVCDLIDRKFLRAAVFCFIACWFSMFGLMHSNNLQGHSIGADLCGNQPVCRVHPIILH